MNNKKIVIIGTFCVAVLILISSIFFVLVKKNTTTSYIGDNNDIIIKEIDELELAKNKIKKSIYEFHKNQFFTLLTDQNYFQEFYQFDENGNVDKIKKYLDNLKLIDLVENILTEKHCTDQKQITRFNQIKKEIKDFEVLIANFFNLYWEANKNFLWFQKKFNEGFITIWKRIEQDIKKNNFGFLKEIEKLQLAFKISRGIINIKDINNKIDKLNSAKNKIKKNIYQFYENKHYGKHNDVNGTEEYLVDFKFLDLIKNVLLEEYCLNRKLYQKQIVRFNQIKKEINDFEVLIANFFNLYCDVNEYVNKYLDSDNQNNFFNREFNYVLLEVKSDITKNNFNFSFNLPKKIETLKLIFESFKKTIRISRFDLITNYIKNHFYGQEKLISNFISFFKKQGKIGFLREKIFFTLVGCPASGKTTFVQIVTESLNIPSVNNLAVPYRFEKISFFEVLKEKGFLDLNNKIDEFRYFDYVEYFLSYLSKQMKTCNCELVVLFSLDLIPVDIFDYFITKLFNAYFFKNLVIFLSFSSQSSFNNFLQTNTMINFKIQKNTMQTYSIGNTFKIFNNVLIPKKVNEFKNRIFSLLKNNKIFNNDNNDDQLKKDLFKNFNITVYETRFLYYFIAYFKNRNRIQVFDTKCSCQITNHDLEEIAGKIIDISTKNIIANITAELSNRPITMDKVLNTLNFTKYLKENEYKVFLVKERDYYNNKIEKYC